MCVCVYIYSIFFIMYNIKPNIYIYNILRNFNILIVLNVMFYSKKIVISK